MLLIPDLLFFEIIRKAVLFDVPNLKDSWPKHNLCIWVSCVDNDLHHSLSQ